MSMRTAGIHIAGSNAHRSAVVVLEGDPLRQPLRLVELYHRIGSTGRMLFSDDRIVGILKHESPLGAVFVDCPLSVPPCVACQRPVCPGVVACEDVSVAYMLSLTGHLKRQGARKKRPINPQSQRLWDVSFQAQHREANEPSYSANLAPLVVRAKTLQRRLNAELPHLQLQETSVPYTVRQICVKLGLDPELQRTYRNFEAGKDVRTKILEHMARQYWIAQDAGEDWDLLCGHVDIFHGFVAAFAASLYLAQLCRDRPAHFPASDGWVFLPEFTSEMPENA